MVVFCFSMFIQHIYTTRYTEIDGETEPPASEPGQATLQPCRIRAVQTKIYVNYCHDCNVHNFKIQKKSFYIQSNEKYTYSIWVAQARQTIHEAVVVLSLAVFIII